MKWISFYASIPGVVLLSALANRFRLHKLSKVDQFVMSYGGDYPIRTNILGIFKYITSFKGYEVPLHLPWPY